MYDTGSITEETIITMYPSVWLHNPDLLYNIFYKASGTEPVWYETGTEHTCEGTEGTEGVYIQIRYFLVSKMMPKDCHNNAYNLDSTTPGIRNAPFR